MSAMKEFMENNPNSKYYVAGAATLATVYVVWKRLSSARKLPEIDVPKGTVVLHQVQRTPFAPNLSPFPIKLEMFLRLAKIPYVSDFTAPMSSKGKTPWITYNGEHIADSQLCIQYLMKERSVDINKGLSLEQKAIGRAIQVMVDEHLFWTLVYYRFIHPRGLETFEGYIPWKRYQQGYITRYLKGCLKSQGIGRHTQEEIFNFMVDDFTVLENFLGDKKFMMGNEPTEVDCSIFGVVSQFVFHQTEGTLKDFVKNRFSKVHAYIFRIKSTVWPDWDKVVLQVPKN